MDMHSKITHLVTQRGYKFNRYGNELVRQVGSDETDERAVRYSIVPTEHPMRRYKIDKHGRRLSEGEVIMWNNPRTILGLQA